MDRRTHVVMIVSGKIAADWEPQNIDEKDIAAAIDLVDRITAQVAKTEQGPVKK